MIPHQNVSNQAKEESSALKEFNNMENNPPKDTKSKGSFNPDLER